MNTPEDIAQSWLRYANSWLNQFESSALSDPAKLLLTKLEEKQKKNESKLAWEIIADLRRLSEKSEDKESAEIRLRCGLVAAEMDNFREASRLLQDASSKYVSSHHQQAVAHWMLGCAQWLLPNKEVEAINSWRTSMRTFERLRDHNSNKGTPHDWYEKRCNEMIDALRLATEQYTIPPLPAGINVWAVHSKTYSQNVDSRDSKQTGNNQNVVGANRLRMYPVYDAIAAGDFGSSGILLDPVSRMEMELVLIEDCPHKIFSLLRDVRILNLPYTQSFYILKVTGTSMNQAQPVTIEDGDYVLMREQKVAENGDIVAAEIFSGDNRDNRATLKRFLKSNNKIYLQPESNDPRYTNLMDLNNHFTNFDNGFHICGVAIAVFKRARD